MQFYRVSENFDRLQEVNAGNRHYQRRLAARRWYEVLWIVAAWVVWRDLGGRYICSPACAARDTPKVSRRMLRDPAA